MPVEIATQIGVCYKAQYSTEVDRSELPRTQHIQGDVHTPLSNIMKRLGHSPHELPPLLFRCYIFFNIDWMCGLTFNDPDPCGFRHYSIGRGLPCWLVAY